MPSSAGPERHRARCEQPELFEYDRGWPTRPYPKGHLRLRDDHGSDDMVAKTTPKTTTATAEAISKTAFPSPSAISSAMVFVSVLAGRVKRSDIDVFLCSVAAGILRFTTSTVLRQRQQILSRFAPRPGLVAPRQTLVHRRQIA
jgi:hypothetical protein